ncbi:hypothetical protein [Kutzneria buriramensis]|uniref:Uncharacterized protein n=1 Tax=Kutzneria buriramensis TaxID=1045776 RepID=A0A3E0GWV5_9PSEU|nr:hypothetical protein [Kutzneria buriramensis]REH31046.1 hypothetical protein BCF44_12269 [Kutzneria buriramensis]
MIRNLQTHLMMLFAFTGDTAESVRARLAALRAEPERGGGKGSMEEILLAVGGTIIAAAVLAGIGAAVAAAVGKLG